MAVIVAIVMGLWLVLGSARLDEADTAEQLGVSKATLANWRWRKYGPPYLKVGRRVEYLQSDIDAWRDAQRRDPSEPAAS